VGTTKPTDSSRWRTSGELRIFFIVGLQPVDDGLRRALHRRQARPRQRLEAGKAALGDGRHVGVQRVALQAGDGQRPQLAGAHVLQRHVLVDEHQRDLPAQQVGIIGPPPR
jgi:hypothetical protein